METRERLKGFGQILLTSNFTVLNTLSTFVYSNVLNILLTLSLEKSVNNV